MALTAPQIMKLGTIAQKLGATLQGGSPEIEIHGVNGIESAGSAELTFVANPKYAAAAKTTRAAAVIVTPDFPALAVPTLRTENPYLAFAQALELFYKPPAYAPGIHPSAVIHSTARIGTNAHVGPYVVVDQDVSIGDDCVLLPHVVIYRGARIGDHFLAHAHAVVREFCKIGNNVILQNGVVVGGDGFGFAKDGEGVWQKIVQSGPAIIEDEVEIQANACIDRASVGETRIGRGVKVDNLVQVGHGSRVGDHTLLCAQVGLAGSTEIGKHSLLAGQAGVAGHCRIGDNVIITAQSGTHGDIADNQTMSGSPAIEHRQWMRSIAVFNKLPELARQLRARGKSSRSEE